MTEATDKPAKARMPLRTRILFFAVAWAIVLLPFYFWRGTWFGRELNDEQLAEYLRDDTKPRHIQHALVQVGERMDRRQAGVERWYPELVRLATHPVEEIRTTDAWVMGKDPSRPEFREALRGLLNDRAVLVRYNAALSLVSFGDPSGRAQIVAMLRPMEIAAPVAGRVSAAARAGDPVVHNTILARIEGGAEPAEVRSPIVGKIRSVAVQNGQEVRAGDLVAVLAPGVEQVWEALRALYLIGEAEDLELVRRYKAVTEDYPERVRQQAELTEKAILARAQQ